MTEEKRDYRRFNVFTRPLDCARCDSNDVKVDISDISCSGIGINTNERLGKGDRVELEIRIPDDDIPMFIVGEVAWVMDHPTVERMYSAGIKLASISRCDKERLLTFIDSSFLRTH